MKKVFLIIMTMTTISAFSQSTKTGTDIGGIPPCPDGYCPSIVFSLDLLNLHKPRTACSSGFGMCMKFSVNMFCNPCTGKSSIKGSIANLWMKANALATELHVPVSIKLEKGFEKADFSNFEIDDKSLSVIFENGTTKYVKGGLYPVSQIGDEFVVNLNFY